MTNLIPLPQGASRTPSSRSTALPAARPARQRVVASVVLQPTPDCGKDIKGRDLYEGHYVGTLTCRGHTIEIDDGTPLGLVAFVLGAKSLKLSTPSFPGRVFTLIYGKVPPEYHELEKQADASKGRKRNAIREEINFAYRASIAMDLCRGSKRANESTYAYWQKRLTAASKLLPAKLRHVVELEKAAGYFKTGEPVPASQYANWSAAVQAAEVRKSRNG